MTALLIYSVAVFFLIMGLVALFKPEHVTSFFLLPSLPSDMRNEVRAVYGGFGVAMVAILVAATRLPSSRDGILLTVAIALFGMAGGRIVSFAIERDVGKYPYVYLVVEILLGSALLYARTDSL